MPSLCEICGKTREGGEEKLIIVVSLIQRISVCNECLNDYANHDYEKLIMKLKGGN
jgi:ribosome-binding protein aMBF1 (putative translation factor)